MLESFHKVAGMKWSDNWKLSTTNMLLTTTLLTLFTFYLKETYRDEGSKSTCEYVMCW